jgi:hypothetical protein
MTIKLFGKTLFSAIFAVAALTCFAQTSYNAAPKSVNKISELLPRIEDTLQKQFQTQKLVWPPSYVYIRSFKYDRQLEVWVKNDLKSPYKLFKTYKVCMQSGTTGPKRMEGDYQVPEGFYYINEFNPNSNYHLSLGLNYPNVSDRILSDSTRPGSAIYIHGSCVSVGCIPIDDLPIEELFVIGNAVKNQGQEFIPVHIFPVRYNVKESMSYLTNSIKDNEYLKQFNKSIKPAFDYFELQKELPVVTVNQKGDYVIY